MQDIADKLIVQNSRAISSSNIVASGINRPLSVLLGSTPNKIICSVIISRMVNMMYVSLLRQWLTVKGTAHEAVNTNLLSNAQMRDHIAVRFHRVKQFFTFNCTSSFVDTLYTTHIRDSIIRIFDTFTPFFVRQINNRLNFFQSANVTLTGTAVMIYALFAKFVFTKVIQRERFFAFRTLFSIHKYNVSQSVIQHKLYTA